ncbi:MAG: GAF domain-containing protein [Polyangiaceae bacterium]|nr:GAF domain-containing protein [Polyangiaceae bacterium]
MESEPHASSDLAGLPREVLDALLEGCQVVDRSYRYVYVNRTAAAQGQTTPEALLGRRMEEAYPGIDATEMFATLRRCMQERVPLELENEFAFANGSMGWFQLRFRPVAAGVAIFSLDLTPRREAEAASERARRAVAVLSATNRTLVRARDEQRFAEDVCRIAVGLGGYRLAWIALAGRSGGHALRPLARAGVDDGYVDFVCATPIEADPRPSPVKRAVRSGRPAIEQRLAPDERAAPWHTAAVARGFGAVAAFPISVAGEVVGALAVYAAEPDSCDPSEVAVLEELALDVGHGLATLRARAELKRTTLEAAESEERYRALFRNASVGIAHCRVLYAGEAARDFVYLDANPAFERLAGGRAVTGELGSKVVLHGDGREDSWLELLDRVARSRVPESLEDQLEAAGEWVELSAYSPEPAHVVLVVAVVTSRKQHEAALVHFNHQLERLTLVAQDLSQARTTDAVVDIVRRAARQLVDADGATFVLREGDACHYVHEDAVAPLWRGRRFPLAACISGWSMLHREPVVLEDVFADPRIPVDVYRATFVHSLVMVPIRSRDPVGAIGAYWAVHRRASPEEVRILRALADSAAIALDNVGALAELEEAEARIRAIQDHLPTAQVVWEPRGAEFVLTSANRAARTCLGAEDALVPGRPASALAEALPGLPADLAACASAGAVVRREVVARPGSATPRTLTVTYGPIPDGCVVLHAEDVTEQRATEAQLQTAQRLEAVGRLAGGVAHDFNNLLSVILSYAGFVAEALREGDPLRAEALEIVRAGERATALTRQLLAFSRKQVLEPKVVDVNRVVTGIEQMLRRLLGADIQIETHLAAGLGATVADEGQLEQVLMNLAVNARDAMPGGGKLVIETRDDDTGPAEAPAEAAGRQWVVLSVRDTGTGIDPATLAHVFEPFFTTKALGKGTGLGLSTVYGIARQSGGHVSVASRVGDGTTFSVYLPRVEASIVPRAAAAPAPTHAAGGETLLLVEDDPAVQRLTDRILRAAGYGVIVTGSASEALERLSGEPRPVDAVLTDIVLPDSSGVALAERLRVAHPELRVVFMSGYPGDAFSGRLEADATTHFVAKPFTPEELTRKLREVLDRR